MPDSKHFLISNAQQFVPSGSIITFDPEMVESDGAYILTGYIPQDFSIQITQEKRDIQIKNIGNLPAIWWKLDNPFRPEIVTQTMLLPGKSITFEDHCGHEDQQYLTTTALNPNDRSAGKLFPVIVRMQISLSGGNKIHIEYE